MWRTLDIEFYSRKWLFSPEHREQELAQWIEKYNKHRVHLGIKGLTPLQKLINLNASTLNESHQSSSAVKELATL